MQTVCAHCYSSLSLREQRSRCMLCTTCERNWVQGHQRRQHANKFKSLSTLTAWQPTRDSLQGDEAAAA